MRVFEVRRILQPVADCTVHTNVREPDQRQLEANIAVCEDSDNGKRDGERLQVPEVVDGGADSGTEQVADRSKVRSEEKNEEQPPLIVGVEVKNDRTDEERCSLDSEQYRRQAIQQERTTGFEPATLSLGS